MDSSANTTTPVIPDPVTSVAPEAASAPNLMSVLLLMSGIVLSRIGACIDRHFIVLRQLAWRHNKVRQLVMLACATARFRGGWQFVRGSSSSLEGNPKGLSISNSFANVFDRTREIERGLQVSGRLIWRSRSTCWRHRAMKRGASSTGSRSRSTV